MTRPSPSILSAVIAEGSAKRLALILALSALTAGMDMNAKPGATNK